MGEYRSRDVGVALPAAEAWATIEKSHTGVFTTLRRDGFPIALPVWFVLLHNRIYLRTPARSMKVARIRTDERASFLVEAGRRWSELRAVHLTGTAAIVEGSSVEGENAYTALDRKYADYKVATAAIDGKAAAHYRVMQIIRLTPDPRILSWDNRRLQAE